MKRFSALRMHTPGLPPTPPQRVVAPSRRPAAAPIWQAAALLAVGALIVFLFVRAVRLSLLAAAPPPVQAATTPAAPALAAPPADTPASAWPKPSFPTPQGDGRQNRNYYYNRPQSYYGDGQPPGPVNGDDNDGYRNYPLPNTSTNNYPDYQGSGTDDTPPPPRHYVHERREF